MPKREVKRPIISDFPSPTKTPRYLGLPNLENRHIAWRFSRAEMTGPFSCGVLCLEEHQQLWDRLREFEKMNVAQLRNTGSYHAKPLGELHRDYKRRLEEMELDDVDELHSFRIDGACRLWCVKYENIFSIVWWDKEHEVAPAPKKNT